MTDLEIKQIVDLDGEVVGAGWYTTSELGNKWRINVDTDYALTILRSGTEEAIGFTVPAAEEESVIGFLGTDPATWKVGFFLDAKTAAAAIRAHARRS
jgi:hypothetical protein